MIPNKTNNNKKKWGLYLKDEKKLERGKIEKKL